VPVGDALSTGLAGLDAQLGGGVPPGTVHLLLGEPMNALELFTYHFAASNPKAGIKSQFVTTSGTEADVQSGIKAIGGDPAKAAVSSLAGAKTWTLPNPTAGHRYVLDSFSEVALHIGWDKAYDRLTELREKVRAGKGNLLITAVPELHTPREIALLKLWADGVLELGFDRQGFGLYPYLKVTKMRGVPDSARFLLFKETERGLFMESTRRVF
jgi:KaiC/GvpD/RAD55 family RecA-like ATPase